MSRRLLRLFLYTFLAAAATQSDGLAQCNLGCEPSFKNGYSAAAQHSIYLDTNTLSPAGVTAAQNAIDAWNQAYANNGTAAPFVAITNPFAAQVIVQDDPTLRGSLSGGVTTGGNIAINPDYDQAPNFLKQVLLHELGHVIGWQDVYTSGCDGQTVMYGIVDPNASSFLTGLTSTDRCYLSAKLIPPDRERPPREGGGGAGGGGFNLPGCGDDCSPIVFNFANGGYRLTGANAPVWFDIMGSGKLSHIGWTVAGADEAFLWLDRNNNGIVDDGSELFGTATRLQNGTLASNGFEALKEFDSNHDGWIDSQDAVWPHLLLWRDLNHDGVSQSGEIEPLDRSGIVRISLDYHAERRRDPYGNLFKYASTVRITKDRRREETRDAVVYDIFFVSVR
jgi:hypothetical protein